MVLSFAPLDAFAAAILVILLVSISSVLVGGTKTISSNLGQGTTTEVSVLGFKADMKVYGFMHRESVRVRRVFKGIRPR